VQIASESHESSIECQHRETPRPTHADRQSINAGDGTGETKRRDGNGRAARSSFRADGCWVDWLAQRRHRGHTPFLSGEEMRGPGFDLLRTGRKLILSASFREE